MNHGLDPTHALTVLTRLAHRRPEHVELLERAFANESRLDALAGAAIAVAVDTGDPIGAALARRLSASPHPVRAERLLERLPTKTVALREVKLVVTGQVLAWRRDMSAAMPADNVVQTFVAGACIDYSAALRELGRHGEALTVAEEAVMRCRTRATGRQNIFGVYLAARGTSADFEPAAR